MDLRKGFVSNETKENISHIRTPMTPDNRPKRIGLLLIGAALIIAGVIILVVSCSNNAQTAQTESTTAIETQVTTPAE